MQPAIHSFGPPLPCGAYLLHIALKQATDLAFGRFMNGKRIELRAGSYLYIGSAMARKGSTSLPHRLLRHSRRSGAQPPHRLYAALACYLQEVSLLPMPRPVPSRKKLHWNIDHLLDLSAAELAAIYVLHSAVNLEDSLADFFAAEPQATVFAPGLGAHDAPGHTHLFYIEATANWWRRLNERLNAAFYLA